MPLCKGKKDANCVCNVYLRSNFVENIGNVDKCKRKHCWNEAVYGESKASSVFWKSFEAGFQSIWQHVSSFWGKMIAGYAKNFEISARCFATLDLFSYLEAFIYEVCEHVISIHPLLFTLKKLIISFCGSDLTWLKKW